MIISIRGTSGSGKTYLANMVLRGEGIYEPPRETSMHDLPPGLPARTRPWAYERRRLDGGRRMVILGSYQAATGGCDTISSNDIPFDLCRHFAAADCDVFFEGLLMSAEQHRTAAMHHDGLGVHLFYLNLTLEECLAGVVQRRATKGNSKPLDPKTTKDRWRSLGSWKDEKWVRNPKVIQEPRDPRGHWQRFRDMGVDSRRGSRAEAAEWLRGLGVVA